MKNDNIIVGSCKISPSAQITNSKIADSIVGDKTKITDSIVEGSTIGNNVNIGPFAHIRPNCIIDDGAKIGNFVEIKSSHIGAGTKASHLAYIGDADIGKNVNIGCGVIFANYDGKLKHKTKVGNNVFIGSNSNIIAPVSIGDGAFIAAGTTVSTDLEARDFCIGRSRQEVKKNYISKYYLATKDDADDKLRPIKKFFGTDGIRGVWQKDLTTNLARLVARALIKISPKASVVIGRDTRESGKIIVDVICHELKNKGVLVHYLGVVSTPCLSYMTKIKCADYGIMITASHNPKEYNGIKIFEKNGTKLTAETEQEFERILTNYNGKILEDILPESFDANCDICEYINMLKSSVKNDFCGKKLLIDCACGGACKIAPNIFRAMGANVIEVNCDYSGEINANSGCLNSDLLAKNVVISGADIGFAFDGDADRIIVATSSGQILSGDKILYILACDNLCYNKDFNNIVISTVISNMGLTKALKKLKINHYITKVGDKYVVEKMLETNAVLGGEDSGHIICDKEQMTGDGVLCAIKLLNIMAKENIDLSKLCNYKEFTQKSCSIITQNKKAIIDNVWLQDQINMQEKLLNGSGRILLRESGTEEKVRLLVEAQSQKKCSQIFENLQALINKIK